METLQRTANRGSISTATFDIDNSCKFEKGNSETMYRQHLNGDRRTWTSSFWIKFCGGTDSGTDTHMLYHGVYGQGTRMFTSGGTDQLYIDLCSTGNERYRWITNQVFRDRSAWYHIVWRVDTTQSSLSDRMRLYVNGEQITDWKKEADDADNDGSNSGNKMPQNYQTLANYDHGGYDKMQFSYKEASIYADMYIAEFHHCDGYSYGPTEFGESDSSTGIWKPIEPSVSYGNSGCHLDFKDSSNMGNDVNGGTDFTLQNISAADQATDTPTNNFCTLNPLVNFKYTTNGITEGGTVFGDNTGGGVGGAFGTMAVTAGKWYWEVKLTQQNAHYIGVSAIDDGDNVLSSTDPQEENSTFRFNISAARREYVNSGSQGYGSLDEFSDIHSVGDIIGIALNMDDNQISIYGNGTLQSGVANTTLYDAANKMVVPFHGTINDECQYNFGGYSAWTPSSAASDDNGYGTFEYAPPSGYYALCTKNLAQYGG